MIKTVDVEELKKVANQLKNEKTKERELQFRSNYCQGIEDLLNTILYTNMCNGTMKNTNYKNTKDSATLKNT